MHVASLRLMRAIDVSALAAPPPAVGQRVVRALARVLRGGVLPGRCPLGTIGTIGTIGTPGTLGIRHPADGRVGTRRGVLALGLSVARGGERETRRRRRRQRDDALRLLRVTELPETVKTRRVERIFIRWELNVRVQRAGDVVSRGDAGRESRDGGGEFSRRRLRENTAGARAHERVEVLAPLGGEEEIDAGERAGLALGGGGDDVVDVLLEIKRGERARGSAVEDAGFAKALGVVHARDERHLYTTRESSDAAPAEEGEVGAELAAVGDVVDQAGAAVGVVLVGGDEVGRRGHGEALLDVREELVVRAVQPEESPDAEHGGEGTSLGVQPRDGLEEILVATFHVADAQNLDLVLHGARAEEECERRSNNSVPTGSRSTRSRHFHESASTDTLGFACRSASSDPTGVRACGRKIRVARRRRARCR